MGRVSFDIFVAFSSSGLLVFLSAPLSSFTGGCMFIGYSWMMSVSRKTFCRFGLPYKGSWMPVLPPSGFSNFIPLGDTMGPPPTLELILISRSILSYSYFGLCELTEFVMTYYEAFWPLEFCCIYRWWPAKFRRLILILLISMVGGRVVGDLFTCGTFIIVFGPEKAMLEICDGA